MSVKHVSDVEATSVAGGQHTTIQVLISPEEGPAFAMRRFVMQPGGSMPCHTNAVEHEQYVLRGRAHVAIGAEEYDVTIGSVILVPEGVPHSYRNTGDEPYEFLCVVPNRPDTITVADSGCGAG